MRREGEIGFRIVAAVEAVEMATIHLFSVWTRATNKKTDKPEKKGAAEAA